MSPEFSVAIVFLAFFVVYNVLRSRIFRPGPALPYKVYTGKLERHVDCPQESYFAACRVAEYLAKSDVIWDSGVDGESARTLYLACERYASASASVDEKWLVLRADNAIRQVASTK